MRWVTIVSFGAALGALSAQAETHTTTTGWRVAAVLLTMTSVWAGYAVYCGWLMQKLAPGAIAGAVGLGSAVAGYYGLLFFSNHTPALNPDTLSPATRQWFIGWIVAGPILGVLGTISRRDDGLGSLAAMVIPGAIAVEIVTRQHLNASSFFNDPPLATAQTTVMVLAILGGLFAAGQKVFR